uniref:Zinc metalloproteinase nas-15-like isoform X3 n=1 Tax=Crassostrea virginica TaxID=6565 RepID=A0A8B8CZY9_CRAVI|nr:zinc metalloproteinase nas-15-like isoform X3 [Crassostrea virginica]
MQALSMSARSLDRMLFVSVLCVVFSCVNGFLTEWTAYLKDHCSDEMPNCERYNKSSCSADPGWAVRYCPRYCGLCTPAQQTTASMISSTTSPNNSVQLTTPQKILITITENSHIGIACSNAMPNCGVYSLAACTSSTDWASNYCPLYCGLCTGGHSTAPASSSTILPGVSTKLSTTSTTMATSTTSATGTRCPSCDNNLACVWNRVCDPDEVCMLRQYQSNFTIHCSQKSDCIFMKTFLKGAEIICCEDAQCLSTNLGVQPHI